MTMISNAKLKILLLAGLIFPFVLQFFSHVAQASELISQIAYVLSKILFVLLPLFYWLITRVQPIEHKGSHRTFAIISGLALCAAIFLLAQIFIEFIRPQAEHIYQTLNVLGLTKNLLLYSAGIIILNSLFEEFFWRYSIYGGLKTYFSIRTAMIVSSIGFAGSHMLYFVGLFDSLAVITLLTCASFIFGCFWVWLYEKTRSVWHVWLNHMLLNLPLFYVEYAILTQLTSGTSI
ncbi:MAG: type II CAAX endopeptidase family protein [bacterium]|nr:type II CAAX endopeptidase family protein [bacterium]